MYMFSVSYASILCLCGLWMTHPDQVLTMSWYRLGMFAVHGLCTAWLSCIMTFCIMLMSLSTIVMGCMSFPYFFFPTLKGTALAGWCFCGIAYRPWFWELVPFPWCCLCKNVPQSSQFLFISSHKYSTEVMVVPCMCVCVPHDEFASVYHPYGIGSSHVAIVIGFNYYTMYL